MLPDRKKRRTLAIRMAVLGIAVELLAIWLYTGDRVPRSVAMPLIIGGMLLAFIPLFMVTRSRR